VISTSVAATSASSSLSAEVSSSRAERRRHRAGEEAERRVDARVARREMRRGDGEPRDRRERDHGVRAPAVRHERGDPAQQADLEHRAALRGPADEHVVADHEERERRRHADGDRERVPVERTPDRRRDAREAHGELEPVVVAERAPALGVVDRLEQDRDADEHEEADRRDAEPLAERPELLVPVDRRERLRGRRPAALRSVVSSGRRHGRAPGPPRGTGALPRIDWQAPEL
jgi:hypothetical protein